MKDFVPWFIEPYTTERFLTRFCEIGARHGDTSARILEIPNASIDLIDPCEDTDLQARFAGDARVTVRKGLSLDVLPTLNTAYDCILIDGDHNWYTVHNELEAIRERGLLRPGGVAFLHDVAWPYGRRDMYFEPARIPLQFVQPHARNGIVKGQSDLAPHGVNAQHFNALHEGGPRNGVLTAVEDFVAAHRSEYHFFWLDVQFGIGALHRCGDPHADDAFRAFAWRVKRRLLLGRVKRRVEAAAPWLVRAYRSVRGSAL